MGAIDPAEVRCGLAESADFDVETILDDMDDGELWTGWKSPTDGGNRLTTGAESGIIKSENHTDGGKGSGRYPKGSGRNARGALSRNAYEKEVVGVKTSSGATVKSVHQHAVDRANERGIFPAQMKSVLKKPEKTYPGNKGNRTVYVKSGRHVVFDNDKGEVVTYIYKEKK